MQAMACVWGLMRANRPHIGEKICAALYSFVTALALHDALSAWIAPDELSLKWPNDVLLDGQKVAGLLLQPFFL